MVDGEPLAGAPEAAHHLVSDQQDAVAVAQLAHAWQIAFGRDDDAVGAGHALQQDGGDRLRSFVLDDLFQVVEVILGELGFR